MSSTVAWKTVVATPLLLPGLASIKDLEIPVGRLATLLVEPPPTLRQEPILVLLRTLLPRLHAAMLLQLLLPHMSPTSPRKDG